MSDASPAFDWIVLIRRSPAVSVMVTPPLARTSREPELRMSVLAFRLTRGSLTPAFTALITMLPPAVTTPAVMS